MIILVGSGASGKSRLARANKDFSFLEIQSDDKGWNIESCGALHAINLNELGMDKAQKFIDFIRESFGTQRFASEKWGEKKESNSLECSKIWFAGEKAFLRMPYEKSKKWYICIKECTGDPRDNEECFELVN